MIKTLKYHYNDINDVIENYNYELNKNLTKM
jgi:hypothetical protein